MKSIKDKDAVKVKEVPSTDFLKEETITVKYLLKANASIKDPKHVGYGGLFNGTEIAIPAPTLDNKKMKNILTNKEKAGLEYILEDVNLSIYSDFWKEGNEHNGIFPIRLGKDDIVLDLSDPHDYIRSKVLRVSPLVANSLDEVRNKATYRFVMVAEGEQILKDKTAVGNKVVAFEKYVEFKNNKAVLRYILRNLGRYTSKSQKLDFLQIETAKMIEKDPNLFVGITGDKFIATKVLIEECHEYNVIDKREKKYYTKDGEPLSEGDTPTLEVASAYLASPLGQEMRLTLEAKLKNTKE
jgi:hypothetical protein